MYKVTMYVPTRDKDGHLLSTRVVTEMESRVLEALVDYFGGATSVAGLGIWRGESNKIHKEDVIVIYSFASVEDYEQHFDKLFLLTKDIKYLGNQESVMMTVEYTHAVHFI